MIPKTNPINKYFASFTLLSFLTLTSTLLYVVQGENYVQEACSITRYPTLCIKSLASYSNKAKKSPHRWARAGVSVTISDLKSLSRFLRSSRMRTHIKGRTNREALSDCVEYIEDALDNLYKSLEVLRRLSYEKFDAQMSDVLTWVSASLTDEDTCINGFEGKYRKEKQIGKVCDMVENVGYITSNALALVNKLATKGLYDLGGDS